VGASNGSWSKRALSIWPEARVLLIEAQPGHRAALDASGMDYVLAAAGEHEGETHFDATDLMGGVASPLLTGPADIIVPMTTIDSEVGRRNLPPPFLIKLDTHGTEREILRGASGTLLDAALLVVEAYNFELRPGAPRFPELCAFLEERGFFPLDLADPLHRASDGALWQLDLLFARADWPGFSNNSWS
jgi:FkbM family methyltransferase